MTDNRHLVLLIAGIIVVAAALPLFFSVSPIPPSTGLDLADKALCFILTNPVMGNYTCTETDDTVTFKAGQGIAIHGNYTDVIMFNATGSESTTGSSLGDADVFKALVGSDLEHRGLQAGDGVTLTTKANNILINSTGAGEANTGSSLGDFDVFKTKTGTTLEFRGLQAGDGISMTQKSNNILINATAGTAYNFTASYIISTDGTNIWAVNGTTGATDFEGTDITTIFHAIFDELLQGGTIFVREGTYVVSTEIDVDEESITIIGEGHGINDAGVTEFRMADGVDITYIFDFTADSGGLRHLALDGNAQNNAVGTPLHVLGNHFRGEDLFIEYGSNENALISGHEHVLADSYSRFSDEEGWKLSNVFSSRFDNLYSSQNTKAGLLCTNNCRQNVISNYVCNADVRWCMSFQGTGGAGAVADFNSVVNVLAQTQTPDVSGRDVIHFLGAQYNNIQNVVAINYTTVADNTYSGVFADSTGGRHSTHNVVDNFVIISESTNKHQYAVNEADANQNHNVYSNFRSVGHQTALQNIQGSNSTYHGTTPEVDEGETSGTTSYALTQGNWRGFTVTMPDNHKFYKATGMDVRTGTGTVSTNIVGAVFKVDANPPVTDFPMTIIAQTGLETISSASTVEHMDMAWSDIILPGEHVWVGYIIDNSRNMARLSSGTSHPMTFAENFETTGNFNKTRSITLSDTTRHDYINFYYQGFN